MATALAIGTGRRTRYRWVVLGLMFVLYTFAFADRANIGIALPHIKKEFGLSNAEAGLIASLFSLTYAFCQVPASLIVRRLGVRRVVPLFMALTSLAAASAGFASSVFMLKASRLTLGVVEAPLAISMSTTLNNWFSPREKGIAAGVFSASTKFGPVIVPPLGALVIATLGWREVFFVFAIPGLLLGAAWLFLVSDRPGASKFVSPAEAEHIEGIVLDRAVDGIAAPRAFPRLDRLIRARYVRPLATTGEVFRSWTVWGASICYLLVQGIVGVILFLLPLYLTEVKHLSIMNVGFVAASPFAGAVFGNLLGGWISDHVFASRRKPMMIVTFASTVVTMWLLRGAPNNVAALAVLLFGTGVLLTIGYSVYTVYQAPMTTKSAFPVALSIMNTMGQIGTALVPLVAGAAIDLYGWNAVFAGLSLCSMLGLGVLLTIVEPLADAASRA